MPLGSAYVRRTVRMNSVRKGLLGGSKFWLGVFALGHVGRFVGKVAKRGDMPVVFTEKLEPGESYEIRHVEPG